MPGSPPRPAELPARCCCGSSGCGVRSCQINTRWCFLSWKKRCVSLWHGRFLQPRLCVCVCVCEGAALLPPSRARRALLHLPWAGDAARAPSTAVPAGLCRQLWAEVHQQRAQLQASCSRGLPVVRVISPGLAGDGFWSSDSGFLIRAGLSWHGHNAGGSPVRRGRAGEQLLCLKAAAGGSALEHQRVTRLFRPCKTNKEELLCCSHVCWG